MLNAIASWLYRTFTAEGAATSRLAQGKPQRGDWKQHADMMNKGGYTEDARGRKIWADRNTPPD